MLKIRDLLLVGPSCHIAIYIIPIRQKFFTSADENTFIKSEYEGPLEEVPERFLDSRIENMTTGTIVDNNGLSSAALIILIKPIKIISIFIDKK